ncbi:hypothetical protein NGRA_0122 [Nosema granulosis]|uniref:Uncharacterized protein n=1 Tax=Nosema granulosis TaxID=83296 RepID=A0A9P6H456_9MICR|nr:hypothetical protein NGRA_0122 [Nosema granulosis]
MQNKHKILLILSVIGCCCLSIFLFKKRGCEQTKKPTKKITEKTNTREILKFESLPSNVLDLKEKDTTGYNVDFRQVSVTSDIDKIVLTLKDCEYLLVKYKTYNISSFLPILEALDYYIQPQIFTKSYKIESTVKDQKELIKNLTKRHNYPAAQDVHGIIHGIYRNLRMEVIYKVIQDYENPLVPNNPYIKIKSYFKKCGNFLDFIEKRKIFVFEKDDHLIFKKIMIYLFFLTTQEIRALLKESNVFLWKYEKLAQETKDKNKKPYEGLNRIDYSEQLTFLNRLIHGLYNPYYYKSTYVSDLYFGNKKDDYKISVRGFLNRILNFEFKNYKQYLDIYEHLSLIKERNPYLALINEISISCENNTIIPLNFIDGFIKCIVETFFIKTMPKPTLNK